MMRKNRIKTTLMRSAAGAALGLLAVVTAASAGAAEPIELELPLRTAQLERSLEAVALRADYQRLYREAKRLEVAPKRSAAGQPLSAATLQRRVDELRKRVRKAERRSRFARPESVGVSSGTLEAIAACESGGSPTSVSSNGSYRGKYQFSYGTWAGVGGSGDPAAASEREQDYRAALLYARSGSSPWPVCG
jgi:hypothetical protein